MSPCAGAGLGHRDKSPGSRSKNPLAACGQSTNKLAHVAQQDRPASGDHQLRLLPNDEITARTVSGVPRCEVNDHLIAAGGRRELNTQFLLRREGRYWLHPGLGTGHFTDVPNAAEFPQSLLPFGDFRNHVGHVLGLGNVPTGPEAVEQRDPASPLSNFSSLPRYFAGSRALPRRLPRSFLVHGVRARL